MIIGIGNDLVDIRRIEKTLERFGDRFIERCFAPEEIRRAERKRASGLHINTYAKRFAAKEACSKALGTGFSNGVYWHDIVVTNDDSGKPSLRLTNGALDRLLSLMPPGARPMIHLTLTDEPPLAQAIVIIESL